MSATTTDYRSAKINKALKHIPGDDGWPFLGRTLSLLRDPFALSQEHYKKYGLISRINVTGMPGILALGPDAMQQILLDRDRIFSSEMGFKDRLGDYFSGSLIMADFEEHKLERRIMQTAFKNDAMKTYGEAINEIYRQTLDRMEEKGSFHFFKEIKKALLDVAATVFVGIDDHDTQNIARLNKMFLDISDGLLYLVRCDMPGFAFHKGMRAKRQLQALISEMIPERRAGNGTDMLTYFCKEKDENGEYFKDDEIVAQLIFLLFAAHDTTTSALTHAVYFLDRHPEWAERLRDEIVLHGKPTISFSDMNELDDMSLVFQEVQRIRPSVPLMNRRTIRDTEMGGHHIPANTQIFMYFRFTHYMEEYWSDPYRFDPERFLPERAEHKQHSFLYHPFGGGAHKCIGMHFAQMEFKLFLYQFLQRFDFETPPGYDPHMQTFTLPKPADDLPITLKKRA